MAKKQGLPDSQITIYQTVDGKVNIEVLYSSVTYSFPMSYRNLQYVQFCTYCLGRQELPGQIRREIKRIAGKADEEQ